MAITEEQFARLSQMRQAPYSLSHQSALAGLIGGGIDPLLGMFGNGLAQQQQGQTIKFKRYGDYGVKRHLTFIEKLREEIDNWLKS